MKKKNKMGNVCTYTTQTKLFANTSVTHSHTSSYSFCGKAVMHGASKARNNVEPARQHFNVEKAV